MARALSNTGIPPKVARLRGMASSNKKPRSMAGLVVGLFDGWSGAGLEGAAHRQHGAYVGHARKDAAPDCLPRNHVIGQNLIGGLNGVDAGLQ